MSAIPSTVRLSPYRLNSPFVQNAACGLVLALAPGMFTALASLGAGGTQASNTKVSSTVSATLYAIYTFTGWFAGVMLNTVGPRWTMALGAIGYPVYGAAFWYFDRTGHSWFPYLSAVVLGVSAGWLWTTAGYCVTAYSTEGSRGLYNAVQAVLSAMGSVIGAALTFGIVYQLPVSTTGTSVPTAVYACFTTLMILSPIAAALLLIDPAKIIRSDGTKVADFRSAKTTTLKREFKDTLAMVKDWRLMLMMPVFFACDVATVTPSLNAFYFNLRTRTLLAFITTLAAIPTVIGLAPILDSKRFSRRTRGLLGVSFLGLLVLGAWCGTLGWLADKDLDRTKAGPNYDWSDEPAFIGFAIVYFLSGAVSGIYGGVILWVLSAFTNSPAKLASSVGLMKGTIAAGICIIFAIDSTLLSWHTEIAYAFAIQFLGVAIMFFLCWTQVSETNYFMEEDVVVPVAFLAGADEGKIVHENELHHQLDAVPGLTTELGDEKDIPATEVRAV